VKFNENFNNIIRYSRDERGENYSESDYGMKTSFAYRLQLDIK